MGPVIKWVGGKTQLLPEITEHLPDDFKRYIEPFLGGGAVLLALQPKEALVNDLNSELINMYKTVKHYPSALIKNLDRHENLHSEEYYYKIRELDRMVGLNNLNHIYRASRFIYLNKAGYNGMYRVNSEGYMNVPFGKKESVSLYSKDNINDVHTYFMNNEVEFHNEDYYKFLSENVQKGDFVYLDPPYHPISETAAFTMYQKEGFTEADQVRLCDLCVKMRERGAYILLSNSNSQFIRELYEQNNFKVIPVKARRSINSKGELRGEITELLIKSY